MKMKEMKQNGEMQAEKKTENIAITMKLSKSCLLKLIKAMNFVDEQNCLTSE